MRLMQVIVSNVGFREPDHNPERLEALDRVLAVACEKSADLVMLPGGYLTATSVAEVPDVIAEVECRANAADVTVIGGVDVVVSENGPDPKRAEKTAAIPELPFYGFAVGSVMPVIAGTQWKQTSSTGDNAAEVADEAVPGESRVVDVAG